MICTFYNNKSISYTINTDLSIPKRGILTPWYSQSIDQTSSMQLFFILYTANLATVNAVEMVRRLRLKAQFKTQYQTPIETTSPRNKGTLVRVPPTTWQIFKPKLITPEI
jgi:hypothetical protein